MSKLFNTIANRRPGRNAFDLSHEKKLSLNMGELVPIYLQEVVPGDKFRVNTEALIRLSPMLAPVMHRVNVYVHYFFVPNRILWTNWEDFITGGPEGTTMPIFPQVSYDNSKKQYFYEGTLADYFGIPVCDVMDTIASPAYLSALPFRAYQRIYNDYYRDQNLQAEIPNDTGDNSDMSTECVLRKRCWEKDYFTSALPWAQRGGDVIIPSEMSYRNPAILIDDNTGLPVAVGGDLTATGGSGYLKTNGVNSTIDNVEGVDISINDLRRSIKLQEWLEKNARGGARYVEQILSHFGVRSSDARLQRPEYLGGSKQPIVISEVLATFNNESVPGGEMYGHGLSVGRNRGFKKFFEEHGLIMGIMSILPRTSYQDGIPRLFGKNDKFDFYFPEFAHLGEQEIWQQELYFDKTETIYQNHKNTWGYQSRYAEYKFNPGTVHGDFRTTLNFWHMGRKFATKPELNAAFVESDPTHRVFAVEAESTDKCYVQLYNDVKAIRPMPVFGTPMI